MSGFWTHEEGAFPQALERAACVALANNIATSIRGTGSIRVSRGVKYKDGALPVVVKVIGPYGSVANMTFF